MKPDDDALLARLDQLTAALTRRFDAVNARLDGLEQDTAEILGFLIALKASVEEAGSEFPEAGDDGDEAASDQPLH